MKDIVEIINFIAVIQGVFLSTVLLFRSKNRFSNILFSLLLFSISLSMSRWIFHSNEFERMSYIMMFFNLAGFFIHGPLLYLYTLSLVENKKSLQVADSLHFFPFVIYLSYLLIRFHIIGGTENFAGVNTIDEFSTITNLHIITLGTASIGIYVIASARSFRNYSVRKKDCYSDIPEVTSTWLKTLFAIAIAFVLDLLIIHLLILGGFRPGSLHFLNILLCSLFMIGAFTATFFTIRYPELFLPLPEIKRARYEKHFIDDDTVEDYRTRILLFMEEMKPYLNDTITLKDLSDQLHMPGHHLSMVLNQSLKQNFYMFINSYRIEEVKRRLQDPGWADSTILAIAFQTGFNSKSTFNTMFKKFTGMTPTEYRNNRRD